MTARRLPPERLPGWPRWLTEDLAAAYVGVGLSLFREEVKAGKWPPARQRGAKGGLLTWDREALDRASDEGSNPFEETKEQLLERARRNARNLRAVSL